MKKSIITLVFALSGMLSYAQFYLTRSGFVGFYSKTSVEDIKGENNQVYAVVDIGAKNLAFTMLVKGFIFPKELMQEHFNENYMESDKYPKATFSGVYTGDVTTGKDGVYTVAVKGNLTIHGVTKAIEMPATIERKGETLHGKATFQLSPEDYNISIPSLVREKIEKSLKVNVDINCDKSK
jgi:polyisoprenoid-binding protein YceI